jgi:2,3-bisphosphoglycerate-independent phosphoglycerate mutase
MRIPGPKNINHFSEYMTLMSKAPLSDRLLLIILDGWGHSDKSDHNAIKIGRTPNFDSLLERYPWRLIEASGIHVGLPEGQMGNSEVGHLTLGAGRVIHQPLVRISNTIEDGSFFKNVEFLQGMERAKANDGTLHLLGLTSYGGVHSHIDHLYALIRMSLDNGLKKIRIHAITDGRDVPPDSSKDDIRELRDWIREQDSGSKVRIASVMGRFYAMDRDRRWDRIQQAFQYYIVPKENQYGDPVDAVSAAYERGETDEFISPSQIVDDEGQPLGLIEDTDTIIFFNFRPDRARQITKAFIYPFFDGFVRPKVVKPYFVAMTDYDDSVFTHVAFSEEKVTMSLGEVISGNGLDQLRIAETEKYAHVTFFFSGGREDTFEREKRILVPSPKVSTYDQLPEMSAEGVTERILQEISSKTFNFAILNFANPDMVGHTGIMEAALKAIETVDLCLGRVMDSALENGYQMFITADHGNAEQMWNEEKGIPFTAHTTNPVYLIHAGRGIKKEMHLRDDYGTLADISPTILKQMGLIQPKEMTGRPFT